MTEVEGAFSPPSASSRTRGGGGGREDGRKIRRGQACGCVACLRVGVRLCWVSAVYRHLHFLRLQEESRRTWEQGLCLHVFFETMFFVFVCLAARWSSSLFFPRFLLVKPNNRLHFPTRVRVLKTVFPHISRWGRVFAGGV